MADEKVEHARQQTSASARLCMCAGYRFCPTPLIEHPLILRPALSCAVLCMLRQVLCEGDRFDRLIRRAFQTCDELMFKVMRNLAQQDTLTVKRRFGPYIEQLVQLLKVSDLLYSD